jgi:Crp-like helix-turn-helix domain
MGPSTVHVNRMLQQLRGDRLIASRGNTITVLDWPRLQEAGEFTPDYLFLGSIDGNGAARPRPGSSRRRTARRGRPSTGAAARRALVLRPVTARASAPQDAARRRRRGASGSRAYRVPSSRRDITFAV